MSKPKWNADMDHWLYFKVTPPMEIHKNGRPLRKWDQPQVETWECWNGRPDVFDNITYKCPSVGHHHMSYLIISGECGE